jgi:hypothetical protein
MKKLFLILQVIAAIAVITTGVYFARIKEIYSGEVMIAGSQGHASSTPLSNVTVRIYRKSEIKKWVSNEFVTSFLHWKDREAELELLNEMDNLYSSTLGIKDAERDTQTYTAQKNRASKLAEYKKEKKRGFAPVPFPENLFRQIREEIPKDLFIPAKSLFFHKKENIPKPQKEEFFKSIESKFHDISLKNLEQIRQKFEAETWDELINYKPHYSVKQAEKIFGDFGRIDSIAKQLRQFAINEQEVQQLAPDPMMEKKTDQLGKVSFAIKQHWATWPFFKKNVTEEKEFVVAAISLPGASHPMRTIAWIKNIKLDEKARTSIQSLPFFPPSQSFKLSGDKPTADISKADDLALQEVIETHEGLEPLEFETPLNPHTLIEAIALLVRKTKGHAGGSHGEHGHGKGHGSRQDSHDPHGHHGEIPEKPTHSGQVKPNDHHEQDHKKPATHSAEQHSSAVTPAPH